MAYQALAKKGENAQKAVDTLQMAIPLLFGILLIFFGAFLMRFEKLMETAIELFLGLTLTIYGIKRLKGQPWLNLASVGLLVIAMGVTLALFIF